MFKTELEAIENSYILKVTYGFSFKQYAYRDLADLSSHRDRLEMAYHLNDTERLEEEMQ